jgi:hypothetical protein
LVLFDGITGRNFVGSSVPFPLLPPGRGVDWNGVWFSSKGSCNSASNKIRLPCESRPEACHKRGCCSICHGWFSVHARCKLQKTSYSHHFRCKNSATY